MAKIESKICKMTRRRYVYKTGHLYCSVSTKFKRKLCHCHVPLNTEAHAHLASLTLVVEDKDLVFPL